MLSILLPIYNYAVNDLITSLDKATEGLDFDYEILCWEDGSKLYLDENKMVCDSVKNTTHHISNDNKGRITSRQLLARKAKYNWLLFLDADVELPDENLINNYSNYLTHEHDAVYGGYAYKPNRPSEEFMLRWTYGKSYESVNAVIRNKSPYKVVISGNFMIKKNVFLDINSEIKSDGYGYDNIFGALMKSKSTKVFHIDNAVFHNGLDRNALFLKKTEHAVETLFYNYHSLEVKSTDNTLLELYKSLKRFRIHKIVAILFNLFKHPIRIQLLSKRPSMKLFQFYKLGYLCALSPNKR